ncbi:hypothetical protein RKD20_003431 [Streptomyces sp. SLBN-8D4]
MPARTVFGTGIVMFVDETTSGSRSDGWGLEIAEERVAVRELLRRRVFQEVAEYYARTPPSSRAWSSPTTANACWRDWLERHGVTQPFKQAHREVYLLTDAECTTGTYSNRFAAHVPRQHQFHALAAARGWRNKLRLAVDDEAPPAVRDLPRWGLRAEYRMWLRDGAVPVDPLPLTRIPPLVLSEVLRDVDLFVGLAGIGNDPTWQDGGPGGRFQEYWTSYGFGELNQSAETRRLLLDRLIPRLAIADRCTLEAASSTSRATATRTRSTSARATSSAPRTTSSSASSRSPTRPPRRPVTPLRGRPHAGGRPQQGDDAAGRHADHGPDDPEPAVTPRPEASAHWLQ